MIPGSAGICQIVFKRVAENLRSARRRLGVSQGTLGILAGLHRTEIGMLMKRRTHPRIDTVVKLATVLDITVDQLVDGMTWEPPRRIGEAGQIKGDRPQPQSQLDPDATTAQNSHRHYDPDTTA